MLKKDHDRLKKAKKKQRALQQSMLEVAENGYHQPVESTAAGAASPSEYSAFSCPFVWGTAILLLALFLI